MNQLSFDTLKDLIEINGYINSDYSDKDALSFRILREAMRLICCSKACYITVEQGSRVFLLTKIDELSKLTKLEKLIFRCFGNGNEAS